MQLWEFNKYAGKMRIKYEMATGVVMAAIHSLWYDDNCVDKEKWIKGNINKKDFWYRVCIKADEVYIGYLEYERKSAQKRIEMETKKLREDYHKLQMEHLQTLEDLRVTKAKLVDIKRIISE